MKIRNYKITIWGKMRKTCFDFGMEFTIDVDISNMISFGMYIYILRDKW